MRLPAGNRTGRQRVRPAARLSATTWRGSYSGATAGFVPGRNGPPGKRVCAAGPEGPAEQINKGGGWHRFRWLFHSECFLGYAEEWSRTWGRGRFSEFEL